MAVKIIKAGQSSFNARAINNASATNNASVINHVSSTIDHSHDHGDQLAALAQRLEAANAALETLKMAYQQQESDYQQLENRHNELMTAHQQLISESAQKQTEIEQYQTASIQLQADLEQRFEAEKTQFQQQGYDEGFESGFQSGEFKGESENRARYHQHIEKLQALIDQFSMQQSATIKPPVYPQLSDIVMASLGCILSDQILNADLIQSMIDKVLAEIIRDDQIRIRLHPQQFAALNQFNIELANQINGIQLFWQPDSDVHYGGCIVETEHGKWDGSLSTQLHLIEQTLKQASLPSSPESSHSSQRHPQEKQDNHQISHHGERHD